MVEHESEPDIATGAETAAKRDSNPKVALELEPEMEPEVWSEL